jgi:hypothetical protein
MASLDLVRADRSRALPGADRCARSTVCSFAAGGRWEAVWPQAVDRGGFDALQQVAAGASPMWSFR